MRQTAIALLIICTATLHAESSTTVWVSGHWGSGAGCQQWVQGSYCAQPVVVVVRPQPVYVQPVYTQPVYTQPVYAQPAPVVVQSPSPAPVWVAGGWVWVNEQWAWREGYWSLPPACQPQPVCQAQPVYVQPTYAPACTRPVVTVGVGLAYGSEYGYRHDDSHHHNDVPAIPFLPGSHALPRPPKNFPDPLGIFRNDPLGWLRKK